MSLRPVRAPLHRLPLHDVASSRAIEARALARVPPHTLMRRAGEAVFRLALAVAPHARRVCVYCGPGNNGGDGLEAAALLHAAGRNVHACLLADPANIRGDAADALSRARAAGLPIGNAIDATRADLAIDALLGIGASRPPEGNLAAAIAAFNAVQGPRIAVDIASGLHADHGQPIGASCVVATHTLSLLTLKPGLFTAAGRDHAGAVWFDDLGAEEQAEPCAWLTGADDATNGARRHAQHKGSFGDVIVVGGAAGMIGAALLAGRAALAAGAGRVYVCPLDRAASMLDVARLELMFRAPDRALAREALAQATVVCGCGGGAAVGEVLEPLLHGSRSLVLDADALNALAGDATLRARLRTRAARGQATVLTPHPLEAARLLGSESRAVQADRLRAARSLAGELGAVVLLKGSGTVIAAPAHAPFINPTGNAALASPGTGDVLAGWIGGVWSAGGDFSLDGARRAAVAAAWRHGAAADHAPARSPLRAGDLIEAMHAGGADDTSQSPPAADADAPNGRAGRP